jgi:hypothetical protein
VPVVIFLAAALILGGVVVVAMGRGGELGRGRSDLPARSDFRTWSDIAGYRPPPALLGYHAGATEHALSLIARTIAERDAEIDWLRKRLAEVVRPEPAREEDDSAGLTNLSDESAPDGNVRVRPSLSRDASPTGELGPLPQHDVPGVGSWQPQAVADPASAPTVLRAQHLLGPRPGEAE